MWLDNAATTQKPQSGDRSPLVLLRARELQHPPRARTRWPRARPTPTRAARDKVRALPQRAVAGRDHLRARRDRGHQPGRQELGRPQRRARRRDRHHAPRAPRQHRALAAAVPPRRAPSCAWRRSTTPGRCILEEYEKLLAPRTQARRRSRRSRTRSARSRRSREMVAIAHRHGAMRRSSTARSRSRTCRSTCRRSTATSSSSPATRCSPRPASAPSTASASVLEDMPPWQGGGNMIAGRHLREDDVTRRRPAASRRAPATSPTRSGLGAALDYVDAHRHEQHRRATSTSCSSTARERLLAVPGLRLIGTAPTRRASLSFVLDGMRTEDVGEALDQEGIAVRAGHHCAQPILRRFGLEATVRASLALYNTTRGHRRARRRAAAHPDRPRQARPVTGRASDRPPHIRPNKQS